MEPKPLSYYRQRLKEEGVGGVVAKRWLWYKSRFQINNPIVGFAIELLGNRVRMDGMTFSVDCSRISTAHKSTLAFGLHEMEERALIRRWLPRDLPVLEFGGGLGVVACLVNRKLADPLQHVVVEANPEMIPVLERNRNINGLSFTVINKAVAYNCDYIALNIDAGFVGSSIYGTPAGESIKVRSTNVSFLMDEMNFAKAGIVCDIEGAEAEIIKRELPILGDRIRFFMAEMHPKILGSDLVDQLLDDLFDLGFVLKERLGDGVFFSKDR